MAAMSRVLMRMKCVTLIALLFLTFFSGMGIQFMLSTPSVKRSEYPVIVWWTPRFPGEQWKISNCRHGHTCHFTNNKEYKSHESTEGFLFYGSDFNHFDLPLPRDSRYFVWGLLHEESPRNTPILSHEATLELFNYSSTISRHSDIPLTLQYLHRLSDLSNTNHFINTQKKNALLSKISPILYIQSDCDTASNRDSYVKELMKFLPIDSYGKCLNNKKLPDEFTGDYLNNLYGEDFLKFVAQYKFTIAFENGICLDYVTEKLWRPLTVGSIPIYLGSPSVKDWLPNDHCVIISTDFSSPKHLAEYIQYLNTHDAEYEEYLQHKISNKVTNDNLIKALKQRTWTDSGDDMTETFVDAFECFVCKKLYERRSAGFQRSVLEKKHYDCPEPPTSLGTEKPSWWHKEWHHSLKQANILNKLVLQDNRDNFTEEEFINTELFMK